MYCSELLGWTNKEVLKSHFHEHILSNGIKVSIGIDYITIDGLVVSQEKLKEIIENAKKET